MGTPFDPNVHSIITGADGNPVPQYYDPEANGGDGGFVVQQSGSIVVLEEEKDIDIPEESSLVFDNQSIMYPYINFTFRGRFSMSGDPWEVIFSQQPYNTIDEAVGIALIDGDGVRDDTVYDNTIIEKYFQYKEFPYRFNAIMNTTTASYSIEIINNMTDEILEIDYLRILAISNL